MSSNPNALFNKYNKVGFVATPDEWSLLISSPEHLSYHARMLHAQGASLTDVSKFVEDVQGLTREILARIADAEAPSLPPTAAPAPRLGGLSSIQAETVPPLNPAAAPTPAAAPGDLAFGGASLTEDAESIQSEAGAMLALVEVLRTRPLSERGLIPTLSRYGFQSVYPRPKPESESSGELTPYGVQDEVVQRLLVPLMHMLGIVSIETHPPFMTSDGGVTFIDPASESYEEELRTWWRYATFYQSTFAGFAHSND